MPRGRSACRTASAIPSSPGTCIGWSSTTPRPDPGSDAGYELLDLGGAARLERFGRSLVDRPHPGALGARGDPDAWAAADLRYDRERGWVGAAVAREPWPLTIDGLTLELRPTAAGQIGVFPEHAAMLPWLRERARIAAGHGPGPRGGEDPPAEAPAVLHLFAATGLVTLALAEAGAAVVHVDAARPTVAWARRNAGLSGLGDRPVRWIVDDARAFAAREVRRGRRYDGIVLDPPSYGHGPGATAWEIGRDLPALLATCRSLLSEDGFVLLTAHSEGFGPDRLAAVLAASTGVRRGQVEAGPLDLLTPDGRRLGLGAFARLARGAS